jgi:hypothetical protein
VFHPQVLRANATPALSGPDCPSRHREPWVGSPTFRAGQPGLRRLPSDTFQSKEFREDLDFPEEFIVRDHFYVLQARAKQLE